MAIVPALAQTTFVDKTPVIDERNMLPTPPKNNIIENTNRNTNCIDTAVEFPQANFAVAASDVDTTASGLCQPQVTESSHNELGVSSVSESVRAITDPVFHIKQEFERHLLDDVNDETGDEVDDEVEDESELSEDDQETRISYVRLREELEAIARTSFTTAKAATEQAQFANATFDFYYTINDKGKPVKNDFVDNLGIRVDRLKQAWRTAESDRDKLADIIKGMGMDPSRYHQQSAASLAWIWKEALRAKKMAAEELFKKHRSKARELLKMKRGEEKGERQAAVRQRKEERMIKAKAILKEKKRAARAKKRAQLKRKTIGKATKSTSKSSTGGRVRK